MEMIENECRSCIVFVGKMLWIVVQRKIVFQSYTKTSEAYYLPPAAEGCGQVIIKCLLYVRLCIRSSCFYINLNIIATIANCLKIIKVL